MPRHRSWADRRISLTLVPGVPQQLDLLTSLPAMDTATVVRLIGRLSVFPNSIEQQVTGGMIVDIGIGVSAQEAFAVGGLSLPDVTVNDDSPIRGWLYRSQMLCVKDHASGVTNEFTFVDQLHFDARAARKVDRGNLYVRFESNTSNGATTFDLRMAGLIRTLVLT